MSCFAKFLETERPADLGPGPRPGVLPEAQLNHNLEEAFTSAKLPPANQQLVRALILLWHDHLDSAHTLAQDIENADGSYIHAIMHRREPDYENAAYWFRRVGRHRAFPALAERAITLLATTADREMLSTLAPKGEWDPFAFVHACKQAAKGSVSKEVELRLREVQRIEFEVLLDLLSRS